MLLLFVSRVCSKGSYVTAWGLICFLFLVYWLNLITFQLLCFNGSCDVCLPFNLCRSLSCPILIVVVGINVSYEISYTCAMHACMHILAQVCCI